jgi:hypothetical protein
MAAHPAFVEAAHALRTAGQDRASNMSRDFQGQPGSAAGDPRPYNDPAVQSDHPSRRPIRYPLTIPVQDTRNGFVVPQAGAGRAIIPAQLGIAPNQSLTVMPDGRIIARPSLRSGVDERQVIR